MKKLKADLMPARGGFQNFSRISKINQNPPNVCPPDLVRNSSKYQWWAIIPPNVAHRKTWATLGGGSNAYGAHRWATLGGAHIRRFTLHFFHFFELKNKIIFDRNRDFLIYSRKSN